MNQIKKEFTSFLAHFPPGLTGKQIEFFYQIFLAGYTTGVYNLYSVAVKSTTVADGATSVDSIRKDCEEELLRQANKKSPTSN